MSTYAAVIKAGREAKGADPPEAFQAYVGKCAFFFAETWNFWRSIWLEGGICSSKVKAPYPSRVC
jgi:hypothetical protein